mgnify:CR=1 FL=1
MILAVCSFGPKIKGTIKLNTMSTFLDRLREEELEVASKAIKLQEFISTENFEKLSEGNQYLLRKQLEVMTEYVEIVGLRIELNQ